MNLQDAFINQIRTQRMPITISLIDGNSIEGWVRGFDPTVIVLDVDGMQHIVYKNSIVMITPQEPLDLFNGSFEKDE